MPGDVVQAALAVEQVAQQGGKGEQQQGEGDEIGAHGAEGGGQAGLDKGRALQLLRGDDTGAQAHHRSGGADQNGVDEHGQHLHQALLDGVGHVGGGGGVGGGAHAGLVGVEAPLDALHHGGGAKARSTAEDGLHVEGGGEDALEHLGQHTDVQHHDDHGHDDVQHAHHGHQHAGDLDDALAAAHDADTHQNGQQSPAEDGDQSELAAHQGDGVGIKAVVGHAVDEVEGGQHVKAAGIGGDQGHGKDHAQKTAF